MTTHPASTVGINSPSIRNFDSAIPKYIQWPHLMVCAWQSGIANDVPLSHTVGPAAQMSGVAMRMSEPRQTQLHSYAHELSVPNSDSTSCFLHSAVSVPLCVADTVLCISQFSRKALMYFPNFFSPIIFYTLF